MLKDILNTLPAQFERTVQGRVLLLDGDFLAYQSSATVKTLPTALRRFHTLIETAKFMTGAEEVRVHLTARGCLKLNRALYPTAKVYQENRKGKPKPPLLEPLRMATQAYDWPDYIKVFLWHDIEADDALMTDALYYGDRALMSSGDKDLGIAPCPLWLPETATIDYIKDRYGWIKLKELSSSTKVIGHGTKFFWAQMVMGDMADNVKGLLTLHDKPCGPVAAFDLLDCIDSEDMAAERVLRAYAEINQNPLAEAECMWLHRHPDDSAYKYFCELNLSPEIRTWVDSWQVYNEQYLQYQFQLRDYENGTLTTETDAGSETSGDDLPPWD